MPISTAVARSMHREPSISGADAAFQQAREYREHIRAQDATIASLTDSNQELCERLEAANENRDIYAAAANEGAQFYMEHAKIIYTLKSQVEKLEGEKKDLGKDLEVWKSELQKLAQWQKNAFKELSPEEKRVLKTLRGKLKWVIAAEKKRLDDLETEKAFATEHTADRATWEKSALEALKDFDWQAQDNDEDMAECDEVFRSKRLQLAYTDLGGQLFNEHYLKDEELQAAYQRAFGNGNATSDDFALRHRYAKECQGEATRREDNEPEEESERLEIAAGFIGLAAFEYLEQKYLTIRNAEAQHPAAANCLVESWDREPQQGHFLYLHKDAFYHETLVCYNELQMKDIGFISRDSGTGVELPDMSEQVGPWPRTIHQIDKIYEHVDGWKYETDVLYNSEQMKDLGLVDMVEVPREVRKMRRYMWEELGVLFNKGRMFDSEAGRLFTSPKELREKYEAKMKARKEATESMDYAIRELIAQQEGLRCVQLPERPDSTACERPRSLGFQIECTGESLPGQEAGRSVQSILEADRSCYVCGSTGHYFNACPKPARNPPFGLSRARTQIPFVSERVEYSSVATNAAIHVSTGADTSQHDFTNLSHAHPAPVDGGNYAAQSQHDARERAARLAAQLEDSHSALTESFN